MLDNTVHENMGIKEAGNTKVHVQHEEKTKREGSGINYLLII